MAAPASTTCPHKSERDCALARIEVLEAHARRSAAAGPEDDPETATLFELAAALREQGPICQGAPCIRGGCAARGRFSETDQLEIAEACTVCRGGDGACLASQLLDGDRRPEGQRRATHRARTG
jgi:hypothetical protein